jgi:putative PEP-CTERM system histidine kinase
MFTTFPSAPLRTIKLFRQRAGDWGQVIESTLIFGGMMAVVVVLTSGRARSWLRWTLVEHFFSLRYDYRREWMRCIETLTAPDAHTGLHLRAIRAAANVVDSPAGVLFARAPDEVAFHWAGSLNLPPADEPVPPGHPVIAAFTDPDRVLVLTDIPEARGWFPAYPEAWLALPLNHAGAVIGFIVLNQPRARFALDREAFDLLRIVGREIASRVAEQRAAQVLAQTRELREYSQRFAFVIHDIKNVSGQLTMLLANAEVHADNPAFQRDMLVTVRALVDKISRLLERLRADRAERAHALLDPVERLRVLLDALPPDTVRLRDQAGGAGVAIEPEAFDAVTTHILNNAREVGANDDVVTVVVRPENTFLAIEITDQGPGMSAEFIRDRLFRPFASTKRDGLGIGAYQARELLRKAGGDLLVESREGVGTTMRILLPAVPLGGAAPQTATI